MTGHPENFLQVTQGTPEWLQARVGCVTASRVSAVMSKLRNGGESEKRRTYKMELLTEILTGKATEHYVSMEMDFGTQNEPLARCAYDMSIGIESEMVGFVLHPKIPRSGASPDGLVGADGLVELKVPNTTTHLEYLLADVVPAEYIPQMMWQMACTNRKWCDFVSFDPRLPVEFSLFICRLPRDDKLIGEMEREVEKFIYELNEISQRLLHRKERIESGKTKLEEELEESLSESLGDA